MKKYIMKEKEFDFNFRFLTNRIEVTNSGLILLAQSNLIKKIRFRDLDNILVSLSLDKEKDIVIFNDFVMFDSIKEIEVITLINNYIYTDIEYTKIKKLYEWEVWTAENTDRELINESQLFYKGIHETFDDAIFAHAKQNEDENYINKFTKVNDRHWHYYIGYYPSKLEASLKFRKMNISIYDVIK